MALTTELRMLMITRGSFGQVNIKSARTIKAAVEIFICDWITWAKIKVMGRSRRVKDKNINFIAVDKIESLRSKKIHW